MKAAPSKTPLAYIAAADADKQPALRKLHQLIRRTLPELDPCMVHGMIGYGPYHYRYDSGREGDTARVALAVNKTGYSVYIMAVDTDGKYVAEKAKATLGKAVIGKSCIRFKRIEDLSLEGLTKALLEVRSAVALGERRDADAVKAKKKKRKAAARKAAPAPRGGDRPRPPAGRGSRRS